MFAALAAAITASGSRGRDEQPALVFAEQNGGRIGRRSASVELERRHSPASAISAIATSSAAVGDIVDGGD